MIRTAWPGFWAIVAALGASSGALAVERSVSNEKPPSSTIVLQLVEEQGATAGSGRLLLSPVDEAFDEREVEVGAGARGRVVLELPAESEWRVEARLDGLWAPRGRLRSPAADARREIEFPVWPTGELSGTLITSPEGPDLPAELTLVLETPRKPGIEYEIIRAALSCPIKEQGLFTCGVPGRLLDLALRVEGFAPIYLWSKSIEAGREHSLGKVALVPGASLIGRVELEDGQAIPAQSRMRLMPSFAEPISSAVRMAKSVAEAPIGDDGFFQIAGIAQGRYVLVADVAGYLSNDTDSLELWSGVETRLTEPLLLRRPIDFAIAVVPPLDYLNKPWRLEVGRKHDLDSGRDSVFNGVVDEAGEARIEGQPPGTFFVRVLDTLGNVMLNRQWHQTGSHERQVFEMDLVAVEGELSLGKEETSGSVLFADLANSSLQMEATEEGAFEGFLPRDGWWRVQVEIPRHKVRTTLSVEVAADSRGRARVELKVPDNRVFGSVIDGRTGEPVAGAEVALDGNFGVLRTTADASGEFGFRGASPGTVGLAASAPRKQSQRHLLTIQRDSETGPLSLVLLEKSTVEGTVTSDLGTVPGARVLVMALDVASWASAETTGPDGRFEAEIPAESSSGVAVVAPPGRGLKAFPFSPHDPPHVFFVGLEAGELELRVPHSSMVDPSESHVSVYQDGIRLPFGFLASWASGHGALFWNEQATSGRFFIPKLATGTYRACFGSPALTMPDWASASDNGNCEEGYLAAGGRLVLELLR